MAKKKEKEKLVKKKLGKPTKYNFELKMLKLHENHVTTNVQERFSFFLFCFVFGNGLIFENSDQKVLKKVIFWAKMDFFKNKI